MGSPVFLIWIVLIGFMFYFMMIRPQKRARQQQMDTLNHLQPGAQVRTTAQIYGTVVEVGDDWAIVETTPGTRIKFGKPAIIGIVLPEDADAEEAVAAGEAPDLDAPTPGGIGDEPSAAQDAVLATEADRTEKAEAAGEAEAKSEAKAEEAEPVAKS
jgi:preprotein translocase subunit YajC